jgi:hypothetical protein
MLAVMLAERGRELYYEGWRRNDLIRFEKFNDPVDQRPNMQLIKLKRFTLFLSVRLILTLTLNKTQVTN